LIRRRKESWPILNLKVKRNSAKPFAKERKSLPFVTRRSRGSPHKKDKKKICGTYQGSKGAIGLKHAREKKSLGTGKIKGWSERPKGERRVPDNGYAESLRKLLGTRKKGLTNRGKKKTKSFGKKKWGPAVYLGWPLEKGTNRCGKIAGPRFEKMVKEKQGKKVARQTLKKLVSKRRLPDRYLLGGCCPMEWERPFV